MPLAPIEEIRAKVGQEVGLSDWLDVTQDRINEFADATDDHQFIHVDPDAAAKVGFGGTIAHGFLSLSLLSRMAADAMTIPDGVRMAVFGCEHQGGASLLVAAVDGRAASDQRFDRGSLTFFCRGQQVRT